MDDKTDTDGCIDTDTPNHVTPAEGEIRSEKKKKKQGKKPHDECAQSVGIWGHQKRLKVIKKKTALF